VIAQHLERALHMCFVEGRQRRHEFITVEHLLLALTEEPTAARVLEALRVDLAKLTAQLRQHVDEHTPKIEKGKEVDAQPTLGFQRVIQRAILHVQSKQKKQVEGQDVLVAIYGERDSHAVFFLETLGVTRLDVLRFIDSGMVPKRDTDKSDEALVADIEKRAQRNLVKPRSEQARQGIEAGPAKVFISYSHGDKCCFDRLLVHLKPLERQKAITAWSDQNLRAGDKWREKIEGTLHEAAVAVLLVSADFLASDFIVENELPPLLARAEANGLRILQVILKPCGFNRNEILSSFQAVNDPKQPLLGMDHIGQEAVYNQVAEEIASEIRLRQQRLSVKANI
jgi:Clp amino terminal domain, pathogenicity island component/TIR domain